jgi:hypothetical protein
MPPAAAARRARLAAALGGLALAVAVCLVWAEVAAACPFCTAVEPSLTERREAATAVALGEAVESGPQRRVYRLHRVVKGAQALADPESLVLPADPAVAVGGLALLLGEPAKGAGAEEASALEWTAIPLDEAAVAYVFRAPSLRMPAPERLAYFAPFLEHANPLIAEDAYREFGRAPFEAVEAAAGALPFDTLRDWLVDSGIRPERQGFYGMALGLAPDNDARGEQADFLRGLILRPASDYRAGFDGILGGYLLAAGEPGLDLIEQLYLANLDSANGDARHAMTALRFYHQYGREIPPARLAVALRHLLARPALAADAIADLARWEDWDSLPQVVSLFGQGEYDDPGTRRAIVGYLLACPNDEAAAELAHLRLAHPDAVADAERQLRALGVGGS